MNTNDRATLRRWIDHAWGMSGLAWFKSEIRGTTAHRTHQAKRWARFAVACEVRLKDVDVIYLTPPTILEYENLPHLMPEEIADALRRGIERYERDQKRNRGLSR